jgi:hypothetical protein
MKTGFKDRTEVKNQKPKDKPVDGKNSPWDFTCPQYDQRSSCFVQAGTNYGVGVRQPFGSESPSNTGAIPYGRVDTLKVVFDY